MPNNVCNPWCLICTDIDLTDLVIINAEEQLNSIPPTLHPAKYTIQNDFGPLLASEAADTCRILAGDFMSVCSSKRPELIALLSKAANSAPPHLYPPKAKISNYCSAENVKSITQLFIIPGFVIFHMFLLLSASTFTSS